MKFLTVSIRAGLLALAVTLAACGGSDEDSGADPKIRLLNLSTGYSSLDLMTNVDSDDDDDDETQSENVAIESVSDFVTLEADDNILPVVESWTW